MCFVFIWEQTATCATYIINWLVVITEMKSVYCAVRTGYLNKSVCASYLKFTFQSPSWEANIFSAGRRFPRVLWKTKVHNRYHNSLQIGPIPKYTSSSPPLRSISVLPSCLLLDLSSGCPFSFPTKIVYVFIFSPYVLLAGNMQGNITLISPEL